MGNLAVAKKKNILRDLGTLICTIIVHAKQALLGAFNSIDMKKHIGQWMCEHLGCLVVLEPWVSTGCLGGIDPYI